MPAIAWTAVEKALQAWVVAATGLDAANVIWAFEKGARPEPPYISLMIDSARSIGTDRVSYEDHPDPEPEGELLVTARGDRRAMLQLQCFAIEGSGNAALQLLTDAIAGLPLHWYALDQAGVGIGDTEEIRLLEGRRGGILEPRAITEVVLLLGSEVEGRETFVETIELAVEEQDIGEVAALTLDLEDA